MPSPLRSRAAVLRRALLAAVPLLAAACSDQGEPTLTSQTLVDGQRVAAKLDCSVSVAERVLTCESAADGADAAEGGARRNVRHVGGQGMYVRLTSTNLTTVAGVFSMDVTVQNLSDLAFATADGTTRDDKGVRVFFATPPTVSGGTGIVSLVNATGTDLFLAANQPYFQYGGRVGGTDQAELGGDGILSTGEVSTARRWDFNVPATATRFQFSVYVSAETVTGPIHSMAPQVTAISPAVLTPGGTATLTGTNFMPTPAGNSVTIGGIPATVTAATATQLQVTVPCMASGPMAVQASHDGMAGRPMAHPYQAHQRTLPVGGSVVVTSAAEVACNELVAAGGPARYVVAVYNATTSTTTNSPFFVTSDAAGASAGTDPDAPAPAVVDVADPAVVPTGALSPMARRQMQQEAAHARLLEQNQVEYERLRMRFAGDARMRPRRSTVAADPVEPPLTRKIRVARIDGANFCRNFTEVNATRVYYNGKVAIYEDADSTPVTLRAANNPTMQGYYTSIGDQFNADMEPIIRNNFGDILQRDAVTDNNGVIVAFFTPVINRRNPGTAGFVVSCDQFPNDSTAAAPSNSSSNFGQYFYAYQPTDSTGATGYTTFTPDSWYWSIRATFIHETKHAVSHAARATLGAPFESSWLEEGTARHAEELWARGAIYNVGWKANTGYGSAAAPGSIYCDWRREASVAGGPECLATNPRRPSLNMYRHVSSLYNFYRNGRFYSVFGATTDDTGTNWYATSWSLMRFTIDRYGASDAAFLTALTQTSQTGTTNVANRAGVPFVQLMGEWALGLAMDDYPGMTQLPGTPQMPTWNLRSIYTGLNSDPLLSFSQAWPLRLANTTPITFGNAVSLNVPTLRGGGVAWFEISGNHTSAQLLKLQGGSTTTPAALASTVRIAIGRVE